MFGLFLDYAGSGGVENQRNIVNSDSLVSVANPACASDRVKRGRFSSRAICFLSFSSRPPRRPCIGPALGQGERGNRPGPVLTEGPKILYIQCGDLVQFSRTRGNEQTWINFLE